MTSKNELKRNHSDKILTELNPQSQHFNFELWAREVDRQMKAAFGKRSSSSKAED